MRAGGHALDSDVDRFFTALLRRDSAGGSWLPALLEGAPRGRERFGELVDAPGWLVTTLAVPAASGRLGAFEHPAMPSRSLARWFIEHPDRLTWPPDQALTAEADRLRRALLHDEPPGSRARAQARARDLEATRSALAREWWRFEPAGALDCVLITDRLVVTVNEEPGDRLAPSTPWYPQRPRLVRDIEAARQIAGDRAFGTLLISPRPLADATPDALARRLLEAAPHLDEDERRELSAAYLGNLTWDAAAAAVTPPAPGA